MKKSIFKICATFAFAAVIAMAMGASVFAAEIPTSGDAKISTSDTTLNIPYHMIAKNTNLEEVDGPGITYSFSVAPTDGVNATITDSNSRTTAVHDGPAQGLTVTTNPSFPAGTNVTASDSGESNTSNIVLSVSLNKFTAPGVYRYVLTDGTTSSALSAAGIVRDDAYIAVRYVDVYIESDGNNLEVAGYVVGSDADNDGNLVKETYDTSTPAESGGGGGEPPAATATVDEFPTYNITLANSVTGDMGDRNHQFPFTGTVASNNNRTFYAKKGSAPTDSDTQVSAIPNDVTLTHGETYYVSGLSSSATILWSESNNTTDAYIVSIGGATTTLSEASSVAASGTKAMPSAQSVSGEGSAVTFTNNFESVSPTGLVFRYGAPIFILLAVIGFIIMGRRFKKAGETE